MLVLLFQLLLTETQKKKHTLTSFHPLSYIYACSIIRYLLQLCQWNENTAFHSMLTAKFPALPQNMVILQSLTATISLLLCWHKNRLKYTKGQLNAWENQNTDSFKLLIPPYCPAVTLTTLPLQGAYWVYTASKSQKGLSDMCIPCFPESEIYL